MKVTGYPLTDIVYKYCKIYADIAWPSPNPINQIELATKPHRVTLYTKTNNPVVTNASIVGNSFWA